MMKKIFTKDIKEFVGQQKEELRQSVAAMDQKPELAVVQVGENEASNRYVKNKKKDCEEVGIKCDIYWYPEDISEDELIGEIVDLQEYVNGIMIQLPLPSGIDVKKVQMAIDPKKDVDGMHPMSEFFAATPLGIVRWLTDGCGWDPVGRHVVIVGRSDIVGKPLAAMMTDLDATVTLCHSKTKNLDALLKNADLIVCAVGRAKFLDCKDLGVPIVDVGINFDENGKMIGDCWNVEGQEVTPVPGGVGLLTRAALLNNVVRARNLNGQTRKTDGRNGPTEESCKHL